MPMYGTMQARKNVILLRPATTRHFLVASAQYIRRLPQCIVIGVRKAGTTALLSYLDFHPDIVTAPREVHFFDRNYTEGVQWYLDRMPMSSPSQLTMEKSPAYFVTEKVPKRIHDMNSSMKFLLIVREPVERAISDYVQLHLKKLSRNKTSLLFEELAISKDTGEVDTDYPVVDRSLYDKYLRRWLEYFPIKQFHVVDGARLVTDPAAELAAVEQFLGIAHRLTPDLFVYNVTRQFYCVQRAGGDWCLDPEMQSKGRSHPQVNTSVLSKLHNFYRPHNEKFFQMINRTFNWP